MKIKHKLVSLPILCTIIVFVLVIVISLYNYQRVLLDEVQSNQVLLIESMSQTMNEYIDKYREVITYVASLDTVESFDEYEDASIEFRGLSDQQAVPLRNLLHRTMETYNNFTVLAVISYEQARPIVYEPYINQLKFPEEAYQEGYSHRDWYIGAVNNDGTYVSEAFIGSPIREPNVAIAIKITENHIEKGILVGAIRLTDLSNKLKEIQYGESGFTYIIDKNMNIVGHPDDKYFEDLELYNIEDSPVVELIKKMPNKNQGSAKVYDNKTGEEIYVNFKKDEITNWYIISQINVSEVEAPIRIIIRNILMFSLPFILLYLVFLIINSRNILESLNFLHEISDRISKKNLHLSLKDHESFEKLSLSSPEIKKLMSSYRSMIVDLGESFEELEKINDEIDYLANHDSLTGLSNRRKFYQDLNDYDLSNQSGIVIMMDLDNFKLMNDTMGHIYGDKVLVGIADCLRSYIDKNTLVGRFGGDEFVLCIKNITNELELMAYLERLEKIFINTIEVRNMMIEVNFSMGITRFPEHSSDIDTLMRYADTALYSAKNKGKNRYVFFSPEMEDIVFLKSDIEHKLQSAIADDGFKLVYQPQVNLKTGFVDAYEALLRLKDNLYGPGEFIKVAEETGQILMIGRWVLEEAVCQMSEWQESGLPIKPVSVNFSAAQLHDSGYIEFLSHVLNKYHVESKYLEIELTENVFASEIMELSGFLQQLQLLGVKISIDDFGTGYSSISYLISLPVNKIKLDRSLSEQFLNPETKYTTITLVALIHSLGMTVVAEGIENKEDVLTLVDSSCDTIQGYYFQRPLDAELVQDNMRENYLDDIKA